MGSIIFLYRSRKKEEVLTLRLNYRLNNKYVRLDAKTKVRVTSDYWNNIHTKQRIRNVKDKNKQVEVTTELDKLESFILNELDNYSKSEISKDWLTNKVEEYYNPVTLPTELIKFFDYYIEERKQELKETRIKNINVVKNRLINFAKYTSETILIKNVNDNFKKDFISFSLEAGNYSNNTILTSLKIIKQVCNYANKKGLETHRDIEDLSKYEVKRKPFIYLTEEEISKIESLELDERLNNVRDWFLISYYTGQRISDFMRFKPEMIEIIDNKPYINFEQSKTNKIMTIPFLEGAYNIFLKRNKQFPKPISDQKYNDYLKEVCQLAGIDEMTKGTKLIEEKQGFRKVEGSYPKYELVSSHIARRSFATNFYGGDIPTSVLILFSGHSTEKQFLEYIQKSEKEKAVQAHKYFKNL